MSSVLLAAAPQNLPGGLPGALVVLGLGLTAVFAVLGGLTLLIWFIGRVARERTPEPPPETAPAAEPAKLAPAVSEAPVAGVSTAGAATTVEAAAVAAAMALESGAPTVPIGDPFTSAELAAVTTAVAQAAGGIPTVPVGGPFTSAELAAVAAAVAQAADAPASVEAAAIAAAIQRHRAGGAGEAVETAVPPAPQPGAGAWGEAAFAGRGGAGLPVLRRG